MLKFLLISSSLFAFIFHMRYILQPHPHTYLTTPSLIEARGYTAEIHSVTTRDGYILELHRIPWGLKGKQDVPDLNSKKVVFLQHGLLSSSAEFVMNDPDEALAFILADAGYDVWMGNGRGNSYSKKHVNLSTSQPEFWDYTMNEIMKYDLPDMLTYVRKTTGVQTFSYIGHSLGCAYFFGMLNYHPHINSWVRIMGALTPANFVRNGPNFKQYWILIDLLDIFLHQFNFFEFNVQTFLHLKAVSRLCDPRLITKDICRYFRFFSYGPNADYIDPRYQSVLMSHSPDGSSSNIGRHIYQFHKTNRFQSYDYGIRRNFLEYGKPLPPVFDLNKVTVPVGVFYSGGDSIVGLEDAQRTISELPQVVLEYEVPVRDFNHNDFLWAENANRLVFDLLLDLMEEYQ